MKNLRGAKTVVVGLGISGEASARLLKSKGASVVATDLRKPDASTDRLEKEGISFVLGTHDGVDLVGADLVVVSPGVPNQSFLRDAERRGARLISEIELASWFVEADVIAVGGTNGKSTTTELAAAFARTTGRPVFAGGNLGVPLARAVIDGDAGIGAGGVCVVEVSSFQLERVSGFRPKASILLNVTPDHLDRYASFEAYAVAKGGAFKAQTSEDVAIVPHGDALSARIASLGHGKLETIDGPPPATIGLEGDRIVDRIARLSIPRGEIRLSGRHNITNLCAAWAAARVVGADSSKLVDVARSFEGLPHRMALVAEIAGVRFYDDSKGTNVGASVTALEGLAEDRAVLIAGGRDKGGSYAPLVDALKKKGRALVVIGEAADAIAKAAKGALWIEKASSMEDAVDRSVALAKSGDAVLLSPACSSFDMFRDYKHRGDVFVAAVKKRAGAK
jgi:UDP-N-acetylmuramoylalanine--D-glutamate ligase